MKNRKLNQWLWKWHFIAGLVSLPFVLVLAVTGVVYLFNPDVQSSVISKYQDIAVTGSVISYQKQWEIASENMRKKPTALVLNKEKTKATEFVSGRFSHKTSGFVNPYTGKFKGKVTPKDTWMYAIRKLHGELLGGKVGTKIVELIASWLVVLILTGLYVWFPFTRGIKGVFTIRLKEGKQILLRDLHAVTGFWISILLLITLAGGFPWTDVFGSGFKWVQKQTNTGFPKTWYGRGLVSQQKGAALSLDKMITIAEAQNLEGEISIGLPKNATSTFSVSNKVFPLENQEKIHFDQYSGIVIKKHNWKDVGVLHRGRAWVMAFHQGQFGGWNWWLMFLLSIALVMMSSSALIYYLSRKTKGKWGVPKVPKSFVVGKGVVFLIICLGCFFPMFGVSLVVIYCYEKITKYRKV